MKLILPIIFFLTASSCFAQTNEVWKKTSPQIPQTLFKDFNNNVISFGSNSDNQRKEKKDRPNIIGDSSRTIHKRSTNRRSQSELNAFRISAVGSASARTISNCYLGGDGRELINGITRYYQERFVYTNDGGYIQYLNEVNVAGKFIDSIGKGRYHIQNDSFYYKFHSRRALQNDLYPESILDETQQGFLFGPDKKELITRHEWVNTFNNGEIITDRDYFKYDNLGNETFGAAVNMNYHPQLATHYYNDSSIWLSSTTMQAYYWEAYFNDNPALTWNIYSKTSMSSYLNAGKKHITTINQAHVNTGVSNGLVNNYLFEDIYDFASGLKEEELMKFWDGTHWILSMKSVYSYSPAKKIVSLDEYSYSVSGYLNQPILLNQYILTYDNSDRLVEEDTKQRQWDGGGTLGDMYITWMRSTNYFSGYKTVTTSYTDYSTNTPRFDSRVIEYDPQYPGKASSTRWQNYVNNTWVDFSISNWSFDTKGNNIGFDYIQNDYYGNDYKFRKWKFNWGECEQDKKPRDCAVTQVKYSDSDSHLYVTSKFLYNADSSIVTQLNYNDELQYYGKIVRAYDDNKLVKREYFTDSGSSHNRFDFKYDNNGLLLKLSEFSSGNFSYSLSLKNSLTLNHPLTSTTTYLKDDGLTIDSVKFIQEYSYSISNNLSEVRNYSSRPDGAKDELLSVVKFYYDESKASSFNWLGEDLINTIYSQVLWQPEYIAQNELVKITTLSFRKPVVISEYAEMSFDYKYQSNGLPFAINKTSTFFKMASDTLTSNFSYRDTLSMAINYSCPDKSNKFSVFSSNNIGNKNSEVLVPIKASQFNALISGQFTASWNPMVAKYIDVEQYGLDGMNAALFGTNDVNNGKLGFSWSSTGLKPQTLPDSSTLFAIRFKLIGNYGDTTHVNITNNPVRIEFVNSSYELVPVSASYGVLQINSSVKASGKVLYDNGEPVKNVTLDLVGINASTKQTKATDSNGAYSYDVQISSNDLQNGYYLVPSKTNDPDPLNGLDVQDIASMRRHILGTSVLGSPYRIIAADVNQSETVTTLDIVLTQALILGVNEKFPNERQWTFVDAVSAFANSQHPFPYPQKAQVMSTVPASLNVNFVGVKLGDVDHSRDNTQPGRVQMTDVIFETGYPMELGNEITVPVKVYGFKNISAYQFTLKWNADELEYIGREDEGMAGSFGEQSVGKGMLTTLWDHSNGKSTSLEDGSTLFTLRFTKKTETAKITIEPAAKMQAMVFNSNLEKLNFVSQEGKEDLNNFEAGIYPNPFSGQVNLKLTLPEAGPVAFEIMSIDGKKVKASVAECNKGLNTFTWDGKSDTGNETKAGIFIMKIFYNNNVKVQKVIKY
jgi:hypothetical protein